MHLQAISLTHLQEQVKKVFYLLEWPVTWCITGSYARTCHF